MPDLNLNLDYFEHRKTRRLVGLLGRGAEVLPLKLWAYCGKFHPEDGRLADYSDQEIESFAGWWGKSGGMLPAMLQAGFMGKDGDGWFIHDWREHQGHISAYKAKGKAMASARWAKAKADAASIAASNAKGGGAAMPDPAKPTKPTKEAGADVPVELPHGFPKTDKDALTIGNMVCVPPDITQKAYDKAMQRGGRDSSDVPIRDFGRYLRTELAYALDREGRTQAANGANGHGHDWNTKQAADRRVREAIG
jgi:hypothetical protein